MVRFNTSNDGWDKEEEKVPEDYEQDEEEPVDEEPEEEFDEEDEDEELDEEGRPFGRRVRVTKMFDEGNKGYLTKAEASARRLAGADGRIDPRAVTALKKLIYGLLEQLKKLRLGLALSVVAILAVGAALIATNVTGTSLPARSIVSETHPILLLPLLTFRILFWSKGRANTETVVAKESAATQQAIEENSVT